MSGHTYGWTDRLKRSQYPHHSLKNKNKNGDKYLVTGDWSKSSMAPVAMIKRVVHKKKKKKKKKKKEASKTFLK